jgi:hypothetical protein
MVEGARLELSRLAPSLRPHVGCFSSMETTPATRLQTLPDACTTLTQSHGSLIRAMNIGRRAELTR